MADAPNGAARKHRVTMGKLLRDLGVFGTLIFTADKVLQWVSKARIFIVTAQDPERLAPLDATLPAGFSAAVRSPEAMGNLSAACAAELTEDFLTEVIKKGDQCIVIMDGDCVVSYQWMSEGLTLAFEDIYIGFGPRYLYGYNSFTAPSHRGRHLNRIGVVIAAHKLAIPKGKGLAGYIMASNVASLLAHQRVSNAPYGVVLAWPHGAQGLSFWASPLVRRAGLRMERRARAVSAQRAQEPKTVS